MEVPGECSVCGAHGPVRTCVLCGRLVCREHHDAASGACVVCVRRGRGTAKTEPKEEPPNLPPLPDDAGGRYT